MKVRIVFLFLFPIVSILAQDSIQIKDSYPRWRANVAAGMGYLTADTKDAQRELTDWGIDPAVAKNYYKQLKWGGEWNADIHYLFKPNWGLGLKYAMFTTNSSAKNVSLNPGDGVHFINGDINERMYINFIGPSWYTQQFFKNNKHFLLSSTVALGYVHYRNEASIIYQPQLLTGNSFGYYLSVGGDYFLTKNIAVGLDIGFFGSAIKKLTVNNGTSIQKMEPNDPETVSRFDLSIGIRFYK